MRFLVLTLSLFFLCFSAGCETQSANKLPSKAEVAAPEVQAQKAVAGVGKKGQKLKDDKGVARIISGPASTLFKVEQMAVLDIQIPHALQLFQALNGRVPKDHEEFMSEIVKANRLTLPELPQGAVYRFNAEKGELWVYPDNDIPED